MSKTVSLYEAKTHLSALVEEAASGDEIVIAKNGKARARLVPMTATKSAVRGRRPLGLFRGEITEAPGLWDEVDEDVQAMTEWAEHDPLHPVAEPDEP